MLAILHPNTALDSEAYRQTMEYLENLPGVSIRVHEIQGASQRLTEIYLLGDTKSLEKAEIEALPIDAIHQKDNLFTQIEQVEKERDESLEEVLEKVMPQAFAIVKETARRFKENGQLTVTATLKDKELAATKKNVEIDGDKAIWHNSWLAAGNEVVWDMVHYDVQLIGGMVLHKGKIAEMATGEGKTLVSTLPAYLNALAGRGVHIVTVNDYLAKRDSLEMGKIFSFLGLTSGYINNDQNDEERKKNYDCDITYATNSELGFDYLRDNMKYSKDEMVQRGHHFAIVDEIDSCLIDEARTPLVISGAAEDKTNQYVAVDKVIKLLNKNDFEVDEKDRNILLTNEGINHIESLFSNAGVLKNNNFYDPENLDLVHFVNQSLKANHLFKKDKDYLVKDNSIKIVDELTGRILEGRRFGDGLHQAIEAKEKIEIQAENQTLASITYQNYFKLYKKISGCTGTAATESEEFFEIYNLNVIVIPTNKEMIRKDFNDQIFRTEAEKNNAIIKKIRECHENGQPLLVFTSSVSKSEIYSKLLKKEKIEHIVLNAKNHENEAEIIANAGKAKSVIITTSISGRGVDIQLGGKKGSILDEELKKNKEKIKSKGGLFVIGTERMESRRVDNQARGRSSLFRKRRRSGNDNEYSVQALGSMAAIQERSRKTYSGLTLVNIMIYQIMIGQ